MRIITLGTAGAVPTLRRNLPAVAVQREGDIFLFDCGEGTQMQMMKAKLSTFKVEAIFISHLHGDHVVGLPGLLMSLGQTPRQRPIFIYGPMGIKDYVLDNKKHLNFHCEYEIVLREINEGRITENKEYWFEAVTLDHNRLTLGYALIEKERPGKFLVEKAKSLGVKKGPLFGKLQRGEDVKLESGKIVHPGDVLGKVRKGRKIIYATDTRPCRKIAELSREADVLIHDGMFSESEEREAGERGHSTVTQVARMAKEIGVDKLILTHISSRYPDDKLLLEEARGIFPSTIIARDLMEIKVPLPRFEASA